MYSFSKKILAPAFFFFCSIVLQCQELSLQTEAGALLPSSQPASEALLKKSSYQAALARIAWHSDTASVYAKIYNRPVYGLAFYAADFHNPSIGDPLALLFFIKTTAVRKKRFNFFYEIGWGVAGHFNKYDKNLNPDNELIGSRTNINGSLAIGVEYLFSERFLLGFSTGYRHFSNGFLRWPNYGINIIPFSLTGTFCRQKNTYNYSKNANRSFIKNNQLTIYYAPGSKNFGDGKGNYFVSTLGFQFVRQLSYISGIGAGIDLFYNSAGKIKVENKGSDLSKSLSGGVYICYEWIFTKKFRISTGLGLYIIRHIENDEPFPFYERICGKYFVLKNLFAGVGLKLNSNAADYFEWTLGYVFRKDANVYK